MNKKIIFLILILTSFLFMGDSCARKDVSGKRWKSITPIGTLIEIEVHYSEVTLYQVHTTKGSFIVRRGISGFKGAKVVIKIDYDNNRFCVFKIKSRIAQV